MYLPLVDDLAVFDNVVVRVLGGSEARVIGQYSQSITYFDPVE